MREANVTQSYPMRVCMECKQEFPRRHREGLKRYTNRIYCAQKCLDIFLARQKQKRHPILPQYKESEQT